MTSWSVLGSALLVLYVVAGTKSWAPKANDPSDSAATQQPPDVAAADEPDHDVVLKDIQFKPNRLKIKAGDRVRFTNLDKFQHDVYMVRTANRNQVIVPTTTLDPGQSITIQINEDGLFTLYCTIHGGMSGHVTTTGTFELTEEEKARAAALKVFPPIVKIGEEIFWGKGQCHRCHTLADRGDGLRGPNLEDIGFRAGPRAQQLGLESGTAYIIQSIMEPSAYIVEGYTDDMPLVYHEPIDLSSGELKAIVTYLQSQGGEVDDWGISFDEQKLQTIPAMNPFRYGDAGRGHAVFDKMKCFACHTVGDRESISVGPDLTAIGRFRNWTWLAESILDTNAEIGANWQSATVYVKPDEGDDEGYGEVEEVFGILRQNDETGVKLMVGHNRFVTFPADRVESVEMHSVSRMPTNFGRIMTFQEFADLIRYLESLRGPATEVGTP